MNKSHLWGGVGEWGENYNIERMVVLVGNFEKNPKRYQDPVFWVWLEIVFTLKRYQFQTDSGRGSLGVHPHFETL